MYRKYVDRLDDSQSKANSKGGNMANDEDQWRQQWNSKPVADLWKSLQAADSKSLLKKHLTESVYNALKDKKTSLGGTLAQCMSSGE